MENKEKLITLYLYVCKDRNLTNWLVSHRRSNNFNPEFTDQEILCIYLFGLIKEMTKVKQIYTYIKDYWMDWFPKLPSYAAFNNRLNALSPALSLLTTGLTEQAAEDGHFNSFKLIDSMPIIVAGQHRSSTARSASEICTKGYSSSKSMYYYGLKLHLIASERPGKIPLPQLIWVTGAQESDLTAARDILERSHGQIYVGDKIYADAEMQSQMQKQNSELLTPIKRKIKQGALSAEDNLYSTAVSKLRQPIESFFNWLNEKTNIQNARKIRSTNGLMVHVMGRIAAAMAMLILFNP